MSFFCPFCEHTDDNRTNVYGTICVNCKRYIEPESKPKIFLDIEERLKKNQNIIRQYLKKKLGENNGN